jgi:hypothetical protein
MNRLLRSLVMLSGLGVLALLAACGGPVRPDLPLASTTVPAAQPATRAVVVLPGRGDDLAGLEQSGIVAAIQQQWPDADVVLADVSLSVYRGGNMPERLHADVILPTRARGYQQVWLAGASMGGMGVILYDRDHPGALDGLILLAPYLGGRAIQREVAGAGGLASWDPGAPQQIDASNWQHELWRHLQTLSLDPQQQKRVWLVYGEKDRLRRAIGLLSPHLLADQVLVRPGGHTWAVWNPAMGEILALARRE